MKRIISIIALLITFGLGVGSISLWNLYRHWDTRRPPTGVDQKVGTYWLYVNQVIEAEPPAHKDEEPTKARGDSVFIVFYPTGEFASIGCAISTAGGTQNERILAEDDFTVYRGTWSRNDDGTITTKSRLSHRPAQNNHSVADERTVIFKPIGNVVSERGLLEGGGSSYVQQLSHEIKNLDVLTSMIASDNR